MTDTGIPTTPVEERIEMQSPFSELCSTTTPLVSERERKDARPPSGQEEPDSRSLTDGHPTTREEPQ